MTKEEFLKYTFANVNHWLDFAEKKNTILISLFSIATFLSKALISNDSKLIKIGFAITITLYIAALITIFISLFPKTTRKKREKSPKKTQEESSNFLFYGDISNFKSGNEYLEALTKKQFSDKETFSNIEEDIANQIYINSGLCVKKFKCFKYASHFLILAIIQYCVIFTINIFLTTGAK